MSDRRSPSANNPYSGSRTPGEPEFLAVGKLLKPHGVRGEMRMEIWTDFPERLKAGVGIEVGETEDSRRAMEIHGVRYHRGRWLLDLVGIRSREDVEKLRGLYIFLPEQALDELPEGYYYEHHLVGLECRSPEGEALGRVKALETDGGQTRILVQRGSREFLVPWVPELVTEVDLEAAYLVIDALPGLLDDDAVTAS